MVWRGTPVEVRWLIPLAEAFRETGRFYQLGPIAEEVSAAPSNPDFWNFRRRSVELFVNYLLMGQGAVLGRAVSTLRSVEAQPSTLNSF